MKKIVKAVATVAVAAVAVTAIVATAGAAGAAVGVAAGMYLGVSSATAVTISTVATAGGYALAGAIGATALSDAGEELTGTNVIRDKLMGGNQDLYNTVEAGLYTVGMGYTSIGANNQSLTQKTSLAVQGGKTTAKKEADRLQSIGATSKSRGHVNSVAVLTTSSGKQYVGVNQEGINSWRMRAYLRFNGTNKFNGQCAEVNAVSKALQDNRSLRNSSISVVYVRGAGSTSGKHGTFHEPCSTCSKMLQHYKVGVDK